MHRRLIQLARTARLPLSVGVLCGLLAGLSGVAQAYFLSTTVARAFLGKATIASVAPWLWLLLGAIAARGVLSWIQEIAANEVAVRIKHRLREQLFTHLLRLGPAYTRGERSGEIAAAAVDGIEALHAYYAQFLPQLVVGILVPATILLLVFPQDPLSGVILLLTAPLIPFFMYMIGRSAEQATSRQYATLGRLSSHLLDSVQGLATLKIFGQSAAQVDNIARVADQFRVATLKVLQVSFLSALVLELLATISTAIIAVEVGLRLLYSQMEFRQALFLLILAPEFYLPLRMLGARFHAGMTGSAAARRIFEILDRDLPDSSAASSRAVPSFARGVSVLRSGVQNPRPAIELKDVSYTYPGREHPALQGINLIIARGERLAVVGANGAGKSTLAGLLLGFIQPETGTVEIEGAALPPVGSEGAGARIAWVPQDPHLFHESIAANIRLGRPLASDGQVIHAARLAHLEDFVASLPEGYSTIIGEGGARLSSGEAQRLSLARAFLLNAQIVVLDEPSSSLDPENEALLEDSVHQLGAGRTLITIAHRLKTIHRADRIVVLDGGRILERGTHAQLLEAGGAYTRFINTRADLAAAAPSSSAWKTHPARSPAITNGAFHLGAAPTPQLLLSDASSVPERPILRHLLGLLGGSWGMVALSVMLASLAVGSGAALMGTSAWLISTAALHPSIAALQVAIVGVRLFGISRAIFRYLERLASHAVTFRLLRNIRVWFYSLLEPLAPARLMDFRAGDLVTRAVADVETLENLYVRLLAPVLTAVCVASAACAYLLSQHAPQAAAVLATMFLLSGMGVPVSARHFARRPGRRMIELRADLHAQIVDDIQGLADILAFGRGDERLGRLRSASASCSIAQRVMAQISGAHSGIFCVLTNLGLWLTLVLLIPEVAAERLPGVLLAPFGLIVLASFEAVSGMPLAGQLWPATQAAAKRLVDVVAVTPAVVSVPNAQSSGRRQTAAQTMRPARTVRTDVEFANVCFAYPGREKPAVQDISFRVEAGESVAIVGPSGAGKSTLASLLLRFWEYDSGDILLGGRSMRSQTPEEVRAQLGYVSQHPYFFDTSVRENLRLARHGSSAADLERAARLAGIHDTILDLPKGYDTLIGEHGARLSAGERQRLGIARLILRDAPVLLLDEPLANLDAIAEKEILTVLVDMARRKTTVFITHRLVAMECFDQILVLDHGTITEQGAHARLLAAGGLYSRFWNLQNAQPQMALAPLASAR